MSESQGGMDVDPSNSNGPGGPEGSSPDGHQEIDSDTDTVTAAEVLTRLEKAWQNEMLAKDLLEPAAEEVECMHEQIRNMEENLRRLQKTDIRVSLYRIELDRIQYILISYLRTRLFKIQEYGMHLLAKERQLAPGSRSRLMPEENKFLREYVGNLQSHLETVGIQNMPATVQTLNTGKVSWGPNLDTFVFFKVNREMDVVVDDPDGIETVVNLQEDSQYVMRYRPVAPLLSSSAISLI